MGGYIFYLEMKHTMFKVQEINNNNLHKLHEIDRSEIIERIYYLIHGKLVLKDEYYNMTDFPEGELKSMIKKQAILLKNGGKVIGIFNPKDTLIGISSLENQLRGSQKNYLKMDILYVSKAFRRYGIGKKLVEIIKEKARLMGAKKLYISATPSENTINFYLKNGAQLTQELDQELFELEPKDIHLELPL